MPQHFQSRTFENLKSRRQTEQGSPHEEPRRENNKHSASQNEMNAVMSGNDNIHTPTSD